MKWLFIPGWATDTSIFQPYLKLFQNPLFYLWDFTNTASSLPNDISLSEKYSICCYSMGTLKALELSQIRKPEKIIAIGGFNSFCAPQDIERHRKMSVNLMLKGLSRNTKKVLDEFYTNARLSPREQTAHQDTDSLKKGLSYLRDTNYSEISDSTKLDIHLIEGIQDAIVPEATSRMLLEGPGQRHLHTLAGGHGVLENNIKEMSRLLREIL